MTVAEVVLDASVAAKCFFPEEHTDLAGELALSDTRLIAPDLLFSEMASIAAKRVRRDSFDEDMARYAVVALGELVDQFYPLGPLSERAFDLAMLHGFSAYDGSYLALAEMRGTVVITADVKLARRAAAVGLAERVRLLAPGGDLA